jgi:hypothetical protein
MEILKIFGGWNKLWKIPPIGGEIVALNWHISVELCGWRQQQIRIGNCKINKWNKK